MKKIDFRWECPRCFSSITDDLVCSDHKCPACDTRLEVKVSQDDSDEVNYAKTCGDLLSREEFIECVKSKCLMDCDGFGDLINKTHIIKKEVYPSDLMFYRKDKSWTQVIWYNR